MGNPLTQLAGLEKALRHPFFVVVDMTGDGIDTDILTIDGTVFELDVAPPSITAGRVGVDISGGATANDTAIALAAQISETLGVGSKRIYADAVIANTVEQVIIFGAGPFTATEALTNGTLAATTAYGGENSADALASVLVDRVPLASEVTTGAMHFVFDGTVKAAVIQARITATGAILPTLDTDVTIAANLVTLDNGGAGAVDFAATHTVAVAALIEVVT